MFQIKSTKFFSISNIGRMVRFWTRKKLIFAVFIILPCSVEFPQFAFAQERIKYDFRLFMPPVSVVGNYVANEDFSVDNIFFKHGNFVNKGISEYGSSVIKYFSPVSVYGEEITEQNTNKKCDYPESRMRGYINKQIVQCFYAFIIIGIALLIVGYFVIILFNKFYNF